MEPAVERLEGAAFEGASGWAALLLPVGRDWHALDMSVVREVVANPLVTSVPTAPRAVVGVFNLRGDVVPLFDTAVLLGRDAMSDCPFAVVIQTGRGPFALAATAMPRSAILGESTAAELPGSQPSFAVGDQLATVLDPELALASMTAGGPS